MSADTGKTDVLIAVNDVLFDQKVIGGKSVIDNREESDGHLIWDAIREEFGPIKFNYCDYAFSKSWRRSFDKDPTAWNLEPPDLDYKKVAERFSELYYTGDVCNGARRKLLDALSEGRNLYAIWSTLDEDVEEKLELSGLKSYFKKCFVCDSFEKDFGKEIMSRDYYLETLSKDLDELSGKSCAPVWFISDYEGFYKKCYINETIYYDPHRLIGWELPCGCTVHNYDEIIEVVCHSKNKDNHHKAY